MKKTAKDFYIKILNGKEKVEKIYESSRSLVFYNPKPEYETDIVLLPKANIIDFNHILVEDRDDIWELISVARYLAKSMKVEKNGARFYCNMGAYGDDSKLVFHLISGKKKK